MNPRFGVQRDQGSLVYKWAEDVLEAVSQGRAVKPFLFAMEFLLGSELEKSGSRDQMKAIDERFERAEITDTQCTWLKLGIGMELAKADRILKRHRLEPDADADDLLSSEPLDGDDDD